MPAAKGFSIEGCDGPSLAARLGVPAVHGFDRLASTMDEAHRLAAGGAPAGTLVLADAQTAGRGRGGRRWASESGHGLWLTLVERPSDPAALEVLSLRLGVGLAERLQRFADADVGVKWPNDLYVARRKLAGILVEARWHAGRPDWVAVGVGINVVAPPGIPGAAGLAVGTRRLDVLGEVLPAMRAAAARRGPLDPDELARIAARDVAFGRACEAPVRGRVRGVASDGALLVDTGSAIVPCRAGSLVLEEERA